MILEQTGTGASYEEAMEDAKLRLAAPEDVELHFEMLQDYKKGFLGIGSKPAMVRVWYEIADPKPAPVKEDRKPAREPKKDAPQPRNNQQPPKKEAAPKKDAPKKEDAQKKDAAPRKDAQKKEDAPKKDAAPKKEPAPKAEDKFTDLPVNEEDAAVKFLRLVVAGMKIEQCEITLQKNETTNE